MTARAATEDDLKQLRPLVEEYCRLFGGDADAILDAPFTVVKPDSANPYKQLYVAN